MNAVVNHNLEDNQLVYLSPQEISVVEGFNARRYFDPDAMKELEDSIRAEGVQQNLVVRPDPDRPGHYLLIAGERRLRAARNVGIEEIPVLVRLIDERRARVVMALENDKRQNISPAEEAVQAQAMLDACDGDRAEASKLLGWSRSRLDARLLLLHAAPSVLDALAERKIKLGIAELLSGLPKSAQEKNLPVVIEKGYSVAELRQKVESMAQMLSSAIFDTRECQGCPHNSSTQASLFDDGISDGQCMGRSCFAEKTQHALEERKAELQTEFNAVFTDVEKPAGSWVTPTLKGDHAISKEQGHACKSCAHFGALLSTEPGHEGEVQRPVCFDPLCYADKVKLNGQGKENADKAPAHKGGSKGDDARSKSTGKSSNAAQAKTAPRKVRELAIAFLRRQAMQVCVSDPATRATLLLYGLLSMMDHIPDLADFIQKHHDLSDDALEELAVNASKKLIGDFGGRHGDASRFENAALAILSVTETSLEGKFILDEDFLKAHTKAGLETLMREAKNPEGVTFLAWWDKNRGPVKKLFAKKHAEIVRSILDSGFDFSQWVPTCILEEVENIKPSKSKKESHK